jgi:hypothetical protein
MQVRSTIPYDGFKAAFSTSLHRSTQFAMFKVSFFDLKAFFDWHNISSLPNTCSLVPQADFPGSFAVGDSEW